MKVKEQRVSSLPSLVQVGVERVWIRSLLVQRAWLLLLSVQALPP